MANDERKEALDLAILEDRVIKGDMITYTRCQGSHDDFNKGYVFEVKGESRRRWHNWKLGKSRTLETLSETI